MPSGSLEQEHLFYLFLKFKIGFIDLQQIFKKCPKHKKICPWDLPKILKVKIINYLVAC